nr:MAG TPA: hypothetical protein [Caudoviricetes sp.]
MQTINYLTIVNQDYDSFYLNLLKNALKYGMTKKEFWESSFQEYCAYEKQYVEKIHEQSHIQGLYNYIALSTILSNMFKEKGQKADEYPIKNLLEDSKVKQKINIKEIVKNDDTFDKLYFNMLSKCR